MAFIKEYGCTAMVWPQILGGRQLNQKYCSMLGESFIQWVLLLKIDSQSFKYDAVRCSCAPKQILAYRIMIGNM